MSPSNSNHSHNEDPPTYHHMQQALFKFENNAVDGSENKDCPVNTIGNGISEVVQTSDVKSSGAMHESNKTDTPADPKPGVAPNPLSSTQNQEPSSTTHDKIVNDSNLTKSEQAVRTPDQLAAGENSDEPKLVKPKSPNSEIEGTGTHVTESTNNNAPINSGSAPLATVLNLNTYPTTKITERIPTNNTAGKSKGTARRRGKWTVEEEEYVARVIQDFNSGYLNAPAGYTLRSYLSDKLQCDPMRITKKFTGEACIGKRVFHPAVRSATNTTAIDKAQAELDALERRWRRRLELQQRESAKKAAASAAAANSINRGAITVQGVPVSMLGASAQNSSDSQLKQSAVTQAATWLDRANVILMENIGNGNNADSEMRESHSNGSSEQKNKDETASTHSSMEDSLEHQMKEVQRLIYEGPMIQQTTAGLPNLFLRTAVSAASTDQQPNQDALPKSIESSAHVVPPLQEPADKRMRINAGADPNNTGAEDAEALVGFIRSVRASAAAGQDL